MPDEDKAHLTYQEKVVLNELYKQGTTYLTQLEQQTFLGTTAIRTALTRLRRLNIISVERDEGYGNKKVYEITPKGRGYLGTKRL